VSIHPPAVHKLQLPARRSLSIGLIHFLACVRAFVLTSSWEGGSAQFLFVGRRCKVRSGQCAARTQRSAQANSCCCCCCAASAAVNRHRRIAAAVAAPSVLAAPARRSTLSGARKTGNFLSRRPTLDDRLDD